MVTVSDSEKDYIECSVSDIDLFTPTSVQYEIESGRNGGILPITKLKGTNRVCY